ncbi:trypsin-like peptidase domain-containing protein [Flavobacterium sp. LC2016-01]|uniref:trypsin-like serine peptidase n=1 Tax=Flavobacterium sp. LC2016-01 TaxID=2675876 RepID=UPI0012BA9840|nr:trypsin-like peptidase domain-containing protein [Flavobacterium sp. LC2016-01]MTH17160.1 hypothetical protein [Flavobacterium sp. LC2016-01]
MKINDLQEENVFKPIHGNTPLRVPDTTIAPYKTVGLLVTVFPSTTEEFIGTATLIGKNDGDEESLYLLTCAHNLYSKNRGGKAVSVKFIRASNVPIVPFGEVEAEGWFYPKGYESVSIPDDVPLRFLNEKLIEEDINLDYGIVKLKKAIKPGGTLPLMQVKTDVGLQNKPLQINGYGWFNEAMSAAKGNLTEVNPLSLRYPISTVKGASGSALVLDGTTEIIGIHTRETDKEVNQGVRITQEVKDKLLSWMV